MAETSLPEGPTRLEDSADRDDIRALPEREYRVGLRTVYYDEVVVRARSDADAIAIARTTPTPQGFTYVDVEADVLAVDDARGGAAR